jgi:hypothetical protein
MQNELLKILLGSPKKCATQRKLKSARRVCFRGYSVQYVYMKLKSLVGKIRYITATVWILFSSGKLPNEFYVIQSTDKSVADLFLF